MKSFLHVGCGPKRKAQTTKGFATSDWHEIRLDIDPLALPDVICTITDMSAVASESVDAIYSSHNIEHLYPHEVPIAFAAFLRVLKLDGFLVVTCPDLQRVSQLIAEDKLTEPAYISAAGPISPLDILYGHRHSMREGNLYMAHRCGFTKRVLDGALRSCGFQIVATWSRSEAPYFDLFALASKSARNEQEMRKMAVLHFPIKL